jgi:hypothetical protein
MGRMKEPSMKSPILLQNFRYHLFKEEINQKTPLKVKMCNDSNACAASKYSRNINPFEENGNKVMLKGKAEIN